MDIQRIKQWGNGPAIHIPAAVMEAAHLALNQAMNVRAENGRVILEPATPEHLLEELLAEMTDENRHAEMDSGLPRGEEMR